MDKTTHYVYSDELYHYGRKGMKWGQNIFGKKRSGAKGTVVAKKKKSILDKAKEAKEAKKKAKAAAAEAERVEKEKAAETKAAVKARKEYSKKSSAHLTDDEIKKRIERLELESTYNKVLKDNDRIAKGKALVMDVLSKSSENILGQTITYIEGALVNAVAKKAFGAKDDIVNPKKGQKDK